MPALIETADLRAWRAKTLDPPTAWRVRLPDGCLAAIQRCVASADAGSAPESLRLPEALRPRLEEAMRPVLEAMESGRGFAIVTGLDGDRWSGDAGIRAYWLLGRALGRPVIQNVQGTLLYDVRDTGMSVTEGVRFSVTNADSSFHTDNSFGDSIVDYVGLLCVRPALSGGVNQVVSGLSAVEILAAEAPDALAALRRPFHVDRRGGVRPGERPTKPVPVIEQQSGEPVFRYLRTWIQAGHAKAGEPLTPEQSGALDALDEVLSRPALRAELTLKEGEMLWANNRWLLHNRTAFEDHPEPERRRHLIRLWVQAEAA